MASIMNKEPLLCKIAVTMSKGEIVLMKPLKLEPNFKSGHQYRMQ